MTFQELAELTTLIDNNNNTNNHSLTPDMLHNILWSGLNRLRHSPNKKTIIEEWKYRSDLISTENSHANNNKQFVLIEWEKSFVLDFWMSIYH